MEQKVWNIVSAIVIAFVLIVTLMELVPVPFFENDSATLVMPTQVAQEFTARALASAIGNPTATLDTPTVHRFLFKDGTSIDWLPQTPAFHPMYDIVALKTIVLGLFSGQAPIEKAWKMQAVLVSQGYKVQIADQPDPAFPAGSIVIVLSNAFQSGPSYGVGILIRKNPLRVGGQRPKFGSPI